MEVDQVLTTDPESVYRFIQLTNRTPVLTAVQGAYPDFASNVPAPGLGTTRWRSTPTRSRCSRFRRAIS